MGYISFDKTEIINGKSSEIKIDNLDCFLALYNYNVHWIIPKVGRKCEEIPPLTQYLLWRRDDGQYGVMLPLICGDLKTSLCGCDGGFVVPMKGEVSGQEPEKAELLYSEYGDDPYELTKSAIRNISEKLGSFKLREDKKIPEFLEYIGWCTWDAFYGAVDEDKVIMGLDSFKKANFPLGYMILDDGSWNAKDDYLNTASVKKSKFPDGLHSLINRAKKEYGLKMFGIWHCFTAYWGGINPDGELAKKYHYIKSHVDIRPWLEGDNSQDCFAITPEDIGAFYEELHSYLFNQGADLLKIDGQSSLDLFTEGKVGQGTTMKKYQQAMQKAAEKYFDSRVIHCMSNSIDVAYNMQTTNCWRNSNDYVPTGDMNMQKGHIYTNAMNAVWTSTFSVPDWDMFQTHSEGAEFHAAARAISGGPVYVCDYPEKQKFDILNALITSEGKLLGCKNPALPAEDCLFSDCLHEKKLLKICNTNGKIGVMGIFNCYVESEPVSGNYSATDIKNLVGDKFAVYSFRNKEVTVLDLNTPVNITLDDSDYDVITISPIENGIAAIGLADKYNSSAAIISSKWENNSYATEILDGGRISFYCQSKPARVLCNNKAAVFSYDDASGLLSICSDKMGVNDIVITLS
ncbi:Sip1-related alpha-galactosidase [Robinsoniella peoriensis]|uniref:Sip1-related alpha-galactosidase n=1 Tax=Robinsoniella peoriensis TaxID=180332 RepID=UPI00085C6956|nr:Sip1-related alpha-galactosidase [Robinsoniella peoriensis]